MSSELYEAVRRQPGCLDAKLVPILRTDNSELFHIVYSDSRAKSLLKVCDKPHSAKLQFESLCYAHDRMGCGQLSVPKPGFFLEKLSAYSMEWMDGSSVRGLLCQLCTSMETCDRLMRRCGLWLRRFHELGSDGEPCRVSLSGKLEYLSNLDSLCSNDDDLDKHVLRWLELNLSLAEREKLTWGKLHGDFKSDNLLQSEDRIIGIDIEAHGSGTQVMDVVQFLSNMELLMSHNIIVYLRNRNRQLDVAFMQAYNPGLELYESVSFLWLRVYHMQHMKQVMNPSIDPLARWRRYVLSRRINQLLMLK